MSDTYDQMMAAILRAADMGKTAARAAENGDWDSWSHWAAKAVEEHNKAWALRNEWQRQEAMKIRMVEAVEKTFETLPDSDVRPAGRARPNPGGAA